MSGGHSSQIDLELGGASLLAVKFKVKTESELDHFFGSSGSTKSELFWLECKCKKSENSSELGL